MRFNHSLLAAMLVSSLIISFCLQTSAEAEKEDGYERGIFQSLEPTDLASAEDRFSSVQISALSVILEVLEQSALSYEEVASLRGTTERSDCPVLFGCAKIGGECDGNIFPFDQLCTKCCPVGSGCVNNKCVTSYEGIACTEVCPESTTYACLNGKCSSRRFPGDSCSSDEQCEGATVCKKKKCVGLAENDPCTPLTCAYGLYCAQQNATAQVCLPSKPLGAPCEDSNECVGIAECEDVCFAPYIQDAGSSCTVDDSQCSLGLSCEHDVCTAQPPTPIHCASSDDCPGNAALCTCSPFSGENFCAGLSTPNYPSACGPLLNSFQQCVDQHQCSLSYFELEKPSNGLTPNSCAHRECNSQYNSFIGCLCGGTEAILGSCVAFSDAITCQDPDGLSSDSGSDSDNGTQFYLYVLVGAILVVIVLAVLAGIGIYCYLQRRKPTYVNMQNEEELSSAGGGLTEYDDDNY
mmetsp:Transcript_47149/g.118764  ORF Transcript_47149/g.118764 Transcript_47149/m.118764 type:complete len:465 (-) Transcript_47149:51-1445(-)